MNNSDYISHAYKYQLGTKRYSDDPNGFYFRVSNPTDKFNSLKDPNPHCLPFVIGTINQFGFTYFRYYANILNKHFL